MKIRKSFVSNSSSSSFISFIILGVKIKEDKDEKIYKRAEALHLGIVTDDSVLYVGNVLAYWSDEEDIGSNTVNIEELKHQLVEQIKQLGFEEKDIQLHFGKRRY